MNAENLGIAARVALAAYGQFDDDAMANQQLFISNLERLNGDVNGFAPRQTVAFADQMEFAIPTYNDALPGGSGESNFDVTVFKTKADAPGGANWIHIALRGTQQMGVMPCRSRG